MNLSDRNRPTAAGPRLPVRALIVEDSPLDVDLMVRAMERFGFQVEWKQVFERSTLVEGLNRGGWNIVLSDNAMPGFSGLDALIEVKQVDPDLPFILVSGTIGEETAVEAIRAGADDYLLKDRLAGLGPAVKRALHAAEERGRRKQAEAAVKAGEVYYRSLFETSLYGIAIIGRDRKFLQVNGAFCRLVEYASDELIGQLEIAELIHPEDVAGSLERTEQLVRREIDHFVVEKRCVTKTGRILETVFFVSGIYDSDGGFAAAAASVMDITARRQAELALRKSEEQFRALAENSLDTIMRFDRELRHVYVSPMAERQTGIPVSRFIGKTHREIGFPEDLVQLWEGILEKVFQSGQVQRVEFQLNPKVWIDWLCIPEFDGQGQVQAVITSSRDISQRKAAEGEREQLQSQLLQSQKMEAIGRLAGGVAHDFNNNLSVISGYAELARDVLAPQDPLLVNIEEILKATQKSVELTRQLLAFSRRQIIEPKVIDLNRLVGESEKMLARLVGEDVEVRVVKGPDLWPVKMDPSQADQILANLVVNSRDAMPNGGRLTIRTQNFTIDEPFCRRNPGALPGPFVLLSVSDTGIGMDREAQEHAFEPFFTTKDPGAGTGLGLATIYGIVKQNGGFITFDSEVGQGTTFNIYIAKSGEGPAEGEAPEGDLETFGQETILVVEDQPDILALCKAFLRGRGYRVLAAQHPGEGLLICEKHSGLIDLLITDVVMPTMSGKELRERIAGIMPGIRVLYMSGFTADAIAHRGVLAEGEAFIQKPFTKKEFLRKVRQILNLESL